MSKRYVDIEPVLLRTAYGAGRVPMKVSVVPDVFFALEEIGAIKTGTNPRTGQPVVIRGGNGSAFLSFAAQFLLYLYTDYGSDERAARNDALQILRMIDQAITGTEDTDVVKENFATICKIISGERFDAPKPKSDPEVA